MGQKDCVILPQLSARLGLRQGQPDGATSLDFLQAIYRSAERPMQRRMRAAIAALPLEHLKLSVTANVGPNIGFARGLEWALKIARGEPLTTDGEAERIGEVDR